MHSVYKQSTKDAAYRCSARNYLMAENKWLTQSAKYILTFWFRLWPQVLTGSRKEVATYLNSMIEWKFASSPVSLRIASVLMDHFFQKKSLRQFALICKNRKKNQKQRQFFKKYRPREKKTAGRVAAENEPKLAISGFFIFCLRKYLRNSMMTFFDLMLLFFVLGWTGFFLRKRTSLF